MLLLKILFFISISIFSSCQKTKSKSDLIDEIFQIEYVSNKNSENREISKPCKCVAYYLCQNGTINTNGDTVIDIRLTSECDSYLQKCCSIPSILPKPNKLNLEPKSKARGCGYRNPNGVGFKILNATDNEAEFGEFPWMVAIFYRGKVRDNGKPGLPIYLCGGSLIHPQLVLTAAHCITDVQNLRIRAGEWDTQTTQEQYSFQDRSVASVIIHEKFIPGPIYNDIALLFLDSPVDISPHINVICLPPPNTITTNKRCFSSGWGKNNFNKEDRYQVILKKTDLPIVPKNICQKNLRNTRLGEDFILDKSFVCAGGEEGKDTCTGDGGSPLVCPIGDQERYFQAGIVAWGIGCGNKDVPGVYVDVALFRDWIDEEMTKLNLDITGYEF